MATDSRSTFQTLAAALALFALALALSAFRGLRRDTYWFDVTVGDVIRAYEAIPAEQLFLFRLPADFPVVYPDWLSAVLFSHLHHLGGAGLSLWIVNLSLALAFALVSLPALRRGHSLLQTIALALTAAGAAAWLTDVQATALLALPAALLLLALHRLIDHPHRWWLALAAPLSVAALVNLDADLALLLTLISLAACASQGATKAWISALILASAPLGLLAFAYGPSALPQAWSGPAITTATLLVFALALPLILPRLLERRIAPPMTTVPWFGWLAILVLLGVLAALVQPGTDTRHHIVPHVVDDLRYEPPLKSLASPELPFRCAEELRRTGRTLRIYHRPDHAGFLLYHTFRTHRPQAPLIDDHRRLQPEDIDPFHDLLVDQAGGRGLFAAQDINAALLDPRLHGPLIDELDDAPDWYDLRPQDDDGLRCFIAVDPADGP